MKIAYVITGNFSKESGVEKKIFNQCKEWEKKGHTVKVFCFSQNNSINKLFQRLNVELIYVRNYFMLLINFNLYKKITNWNPDAVYMRQFFFTPTFYQLMKKVNTFLEINTDDSKETKITVNKLIWFYNLITRKILLKKSKGLVTVTEELKERFKKYNSNTITIANGIQKKYFRVNKLRHSSKTNLVFMGSPNQTWHGIDKIIFLAHCLPNYQFHLIGVENIDAPKNVTQYGFLDEDGYEDILINSHIAIGTLALHRKMMDEACPLKTRDYLGYGLPIIIGYEDTDLKNLEHNQILKLPNYENNVKDNIQKIEKFINENKDKVISEEDVRHIFNEYKEEIRLSFLANNLEY